MRNEASRYRPDYSIPPGEILEEYLDAYGMTQRELAIRTGLSQKTINEIVKAKTPITLETAVRFEKVFGRPAHFWNNLEQVYQEQKIRLEKQKQVKSSRDWLKDVPVAEMITRGWIVKQDSDIEQIEEVLKFYGVDSPTAQEETWKTYQAANYRETDRFKKNHLAVSAWLRRGELLAQDIDCMPYSKSAFLSVMQEARKMTTESNLPFIIQKLKKMCSGAGVAFVLIPELKQTHVWGATRWIRGRNKAIMQLSSRYRSNDHFWFTFFHEAYHIYEHGKRNIFIDTKDYVDEMEKEADDFASNFLIPEKDYGKFLSSWNGKSLSPIEHFASVINVAPGIVVGRLQHDGKLPHNIGNGLKVFFTTHQEI